MNVCRHLDCTRKALRAANTRAGITAQLCWDCAINLGLSKPRTKTGPQLQLSPAPLLAMVTGLDDTAAGALLGVDPQTVLRWRNGQPLIPLRTADHAAIHAGTHPALLWTEYLEAA